MTDGRGNDWLCHSALDDYSSRYSPPDSAIRDATSLRSTAGIVPGPLLDTGVNDHTVIENQADEHPPRASAQSHQDMLTGPLPESSGSAATDHAANPGTHVIGEKTSMTLMSTDPITSNVDEGAEYLPFTSYHYEYGHFRGRL